MKLSQFRYQLPNDLIARQPVDNRDKSRLMVLNRKTKTIEHRMFTDILEYFGDGDAFIINDTKVFPALLTGEKEKTGAKITVFLLRELNAEARLWDVLVDPARKIRIGNKLYFGDDDSLVAEVIDNTTSRGRTLRFLFDGPYDEFKKTIESLGKTPLPEELQAIREIVPEDKEWYQTIYAAKEGAVAAPTAGLHFSRELMKRLELKGASFASVTLHAGVGNFRAIDVEDLTKHKMDSEELIIEEEAVRIVNKAKENRKQVCVVGTTTMKAVESSVTISGMLKPYKGWSNKFIFPPYEFSIPTCMVTNFHLPQSPMLMMTAAFADFDFLMKAYKEAINEKYRFFTYGDAMLIL
ncbi:tRNA preQ1(34) S-adenosylmethionine ribosyltransferase-isomerase QueA [Lentimicrobium sp.]|jgi:S-adenosylmethionine:tRNA ribosyltransferase-isomerase|uniref:tRNA preQ1(34) S-adenosylmethionine ribosyltransferase-isomerase QueA n=1 Tax=Lentimicrobium sp. TaxID=2034841 RepID=UPI002CFCCA3F|nr:tRNA preQ1(34) S-adenosylmethionine ribosyltransferase-isomerase QueA [Lentimicrobium sp.]HPF64087.1 tRNA preQ1(34) S-adenosylmethionine ribosyltransferase-isomerase QueA [Lentimicrobium sp.]HPJ61349.1 tRNA preQ1(34) S-adenosylmethionine ribosyltransferase-isomerase QueA [Lentimicrobium sp.]HPR25414.1 tRNA preQ1(34) S-adenosylmethionine ribosyltransferase-isomerase QueA [Lentimicrobium sp.]HRW68732.1 tRNA preQ1(34) S-adenosylmethionine ribosyltransferase-isomerase QueA [Lentimicrobium sp.]